MFEIANILKPLGAKLLKCFANKLLRSFDRVSQQQEGDKDAQLQRAGLRGVHRRPWEPEREQAAKKPEGSSGYFKSHHSRRGRSSPSPILDDCFTLAC